MAAIKSLNLFDKIAESRFLEKYVYKPAKENPAKFAGQMALLSALTKDTFGCYYYVTQSLSNEEIPEEKRKFVAAIDLMNGILNVGLQFTLGVWIDKQSGKWFESMIGKKLDVSKTREIANKLEKAISSKHPGEKISCEQIEKYLRTNKLLGLNGAKARWLKVGFSAAVMLICTQIISKRIFTPLLATPLAGWFKEKFLDKGKKPENKTEEKVMKATYKPWLNATAEDKNNADKLDKAA